MISHMLIMLTGTFVASISQILLKKATFKHYDSKLVAKLHLPEVFAEYLNPLVIVAYILFFGATLCPILAYRKVPLSVGPLLEATGYFWVAIFGRIFLGEKISRRKAIGLIVIIAGVVFANLSIF